MVPPPHHPPAPSISVVIPLYNKEQTIGRALNSVLNQTFQDFEIIVVNDGSTDGSANVVRGFSDKRIRLIEQENGGVSAARNAGIAAARNEVVALLDADDEWKPAFLETIQELRCDFPEAVVWATNYEFVRSDGSTSATRIRGLPAWPWRGVFPDYFAVAAASDPPLNASGLALSRGPLLQGGGFPVGVRSGEDLLTWATLAVRYRMAYDSCCLSRFYFPETLKSRDPRHDDGPDGFIEGLERLDGEVAAETRESLKRYRALAHTMRAEIFIQQGPQRLALQHCAFAAKLGGLTPKLTIFVILSLLPTSLATGLLHCIRSLHSCLQGRSKHR